MKSRRPLWWLVAAAFLFTSLLSGCASLVHGKMQKVKVVTEPGDATAEALGQTIRTPGVLKLPRLAPFVEIHIQKEGYAPQMIRLDRTGSGAVWWNLAALPLGLLVAASVSDLGSINSNGAVGAAGGLGVAGLGFLSDYRSGAAYVLVPGKITIRLEPKQPVAAAAAGGSAARLRD